MAQGLAFAPEVEIYNVLKIIFKITRDDWVANSATPEKSILYRLFQYDRCGNELYMGNFTWLEQAIHVLVDNGVESTRRLDVNFGYNTERSGKPTIHIMMPGETALESPIGINEGYREPIVDLDAGKSFAVYTMGASVTYNLMITSDNSSEVLLIHTFLRSMMISIKNHLELLEYYNVKFGAADVMLNPEFVPPTIFHRNMTISFEFDYDSIDLIGSIIPQNLVLNPIMHPPQQS